MFILLFDLRSNSSTKLFCCSTFTGTDNLFSSNILSLNSIVIDPRDPNYFSLGGCDQYARVYTIRKLPSNKDAPVETFCPKHLIKTREMHITGMSYSNTSELLVSYNNELIYLFQKNMGLGPYPVAASQEHVDSLDEPQMYSNNFMVKGKKDGRVIRIMEGNKCTVNQVEPHPNISAFASSGLEKDTTLWAPVSNNIPPLVHELLQIMESSRQTRDSISRLRLKPEVLMDVFRPNRRQ
ncbi:putative transcription factor WD40-like family [Helianthus annuus]|nr:putative transcription factor WD40-like family [Helianthus annuus]